MSPPSHGSGARGWQQHVPLRCAHKVSHLLVFFLSRFFTTPAAQADCTVCFSLVQGDTGDLQAQQRMRGQPGLGCCCFQGKAAEGGFGASSTDFWMPAFRKTDSLGIWGVLFVFNRNIILRVSLEALLISLNTEM